MSDVNIHFYGERGVINGIILDIQNNKAKIDRFFNTIRLLGTDKLPWDSGVKNCSWLVEPSFAQFGNPDCIAVFESAGKKYTLFFEVKLKSYESSSISIGPEMIKKTIKSKEAYKGQSSKLNVQLSFRYRFCGLSSYIGNPRFHCLQLSRKMMTILTVFNVNWISLSCLNL